MEGGGGNGGEEGGGDKSDTGIVFWAIFTFLLANVCGKPLRGGALCNSEGNLLF